MAINLERFKVSGKVQRVFFRKYLQAEAERLGVTGWCANTADGESVEGEIEATPEILATMKNWLTKIGSPKSQISKSQFSVISKSEVRKFKLFEIRK